MKRHSKKLFLLFWLFPILAVVGALLGIPWLTFAGIGVGALLLLLCILELVVRKGVLPTDDEIYGRSDEEVKSG